MKAKIIQMKSKWRPITSKKLEVELKKIDQLGKRENRDYVYINRDNFSINWDETVRLSNSGNTFASAMLVQLGILDYFSKGHYAIIWKNENANPFICNGFFKEKEDAEEYREAIISDFLIHDAKDCQDAMGWTNMDFGKSNFEKIFFNVHPIHLVQYLD